MPARNLYPFRKLNLINSVVLVLCLTCCFVDAGSIGWFYALDSDKVAFEKIVGSPLRTVSLTGGTVMNEYRVGPHRVVAAKMGSGCVTTAVTVTRVMALNPFDRLISTGPTGGIAEGYQRGEWVRVTETVGWQQGKIGESGQEHSTKDISNEEVMDISSWPPGKWKEVRGVKLVSGEAFVASSEHRSELARNYQAQIVEMNSLGILTSLQQTPVKILILRVISDFANEQANADFAAFLQSYQGEGGTMVAEIVKGLPVGQDEPGAHDALKQLLED